ncbi:Ohr family peroxiredoxin [Nonomuraea aridisoli]|uniref:Organic hydroperoxide resistance protein n=1 Tax=Nonomuraea aridisoli TaxID=2070368 RepID=A0A2W2D4U0_9ACTN|nr:Ohr family peroxiredoxin [Nonomuraea aridisoli]PZG05261.1 organic hydroperoxide resistance protein [Nonomuraea aridisoli]
MSESTYTGIATSTGDGRAGGRSVSDDGLLDLTLAVPAAVGGPGGGTNPEQLFAAGWSACFHSALKFIAAQRKIPVTDSAVIAEVTLHQNADGFSLSAALHVEMAGVSQETADELAAAAHQTCPYSKAVSGTIPVTVDATVA